MKLKWALFAGILFLITGIVLRKVTDTGFLPILLIVIGILFKTYYILQKIKSQAYKPGSEFLFLFFGLALFLSGLYFRSPEAGLYVSLLIYLGIALKIVFILLFIVKIKSPEKAAK